MQSIGKFFAPAQGDAVTAVDLAVRNLQEYSRPNVGTRGSGQKQALQAFSIYFDGRIPHHDRHNHLHRASDAPPGLVAELAAAREPWHVTSR